MTAIFPFANSINGSCKSICLLGNRECLAYSLLHSHINSSSRQKFGTILLYFLNAQSAIQVSPINCETAALPLPSSHFWHTPRWMKWIHSCKYCDLSKHTSYSTSCHKSLLPIYLQAWCDSLSCLLSTNLHLCQNQAHHHSHIARGQGAIVAILRFVVSIKSPLWIT